MTTGPTGDKGHLRARLLAERRARSAADLTAARAALVDHVIAHLDPAWTRVGAYVPLRTEPGSPELLAALVAAGREVLVPETLPDRDLAWTGWPEPVRFAPAAVASLDLLLVPALAVATDGTRLGRGGGSYDRALSRIGPDRPVWALLFDGELLDSLPADPWDRPVSGVVTPSGLRVLWAAPTGVDGE